MKNSVFSSVVKALVVGPPVQASRSPDDLEARFQSAGALVPPYDPGALCQLMEHSNALRQSIDAYAVNIDGFGHRLEPAIELDAEDADARVAEALFLERSAARARGELPDGTPLEPDAEEIQNRRRELLELARLERARLDAFFDACCPDCSFVDLRRRTRQDLETTGNAYWEVLRNFRGEVVRLVHVPSQSMRLMPLDREPIDIVERMRVSPVDFETVPVRKRMRRFVQLQEGMDAVYFKSFGDPRAVSRDTGRLLSDGEDGAAATEIIHFAIHSPRSPYGIPRWVGALLSVLGSRQMEEVNFSYFENKSVPPLALLISGGRLSESSVPRIERFIEENLNGKANFHKILILEAEGGSAEGKAKIELCPLTSAQQQDALFQSYDARNIDKVGAAFRLPRLLRGDSGDFNRATAESALRFAEDQVFQPERDEFDYLVNRTLLADMGIRFWRFRSQTPATRDPERMTDMVEKLVRVGVLTPEEGRVLAGDIFNREFRKLGDDWTKRPITLTLAGIQTQTVELGHGSEPALKAENGGIPTDTSTGPEPLDEAERQALSRLTAARAAMGPAESMGEGAGLEDDGKPGVLRVPREEMDSWLEEEN